MSYITPIERKSRLPQLQGVQGRSRPPQFLGGLRALGNAEDGTVSAFPKGKQNWKIFLTLYLIDGRYMKFQKKYKIDN